MTTDAAIPETPVETRLRATLRGVADAEAVADDFAGLRQRAAGSSVGSWSDPGRTRRGRLLVAAVVVVLAAGAVVIAARGDDRSEGVVTSEPGSGWYLPDGLGTTWDLLSVRAGSFPMPTTNARSVIFSGEEDTEGSMVWISANEYLVGPDPAELAGVPLPTAVPRPFEVWTDPDDPGADRTARVWAQRDDKVLVVEAPGLTTEDALAVLDTWWASDGRVLSVDPALGLVRASDFTNPDGVAGPLPPPAGDGAPATAFLPVVVVTVRHAATGEELAYGLAPRQARTFLTGIRDTDGGAARGVAPDEQLVELDLPGVAGPVWAMSEALWERVTTRVVADLPGATVSAGFGPDELGLGPSLPSAGDGSVSTRALVLALVADLRAVDATAWVDAVRSVEDDPAPTLLAATLADAPVPDPEGGQTTTLPAERGTPIPERPPAVEDPTSVRDVPAPSTASAHSNGPP